MQETPKMGPLDGFFAHGFWLLVLRLGLQDTSAGMPLTLPMVFELWSCNWDCKTQVRECHSLCSGDLALAGASRRVSKTNWHPRARFTLAGCNLWGVSMCKYRMGAGVPTFLAMPVETSGVSAIMSKSCGCFAHVFWSIVKFKRHE